MAFFNLKSFKQIKMSRYRNVVVPIKILSGSNSGSVSVSTEAGFIRRAVIASSVPANTGMVRASIEGSNGEKIAEMQALDVFKIRNVEYALDGVPVNVNGGGQITFKVLATDNFSADFVADLILIYSEDENC